MLGAEDGFLEGMETTILLSTITKIGGLMRVGFGEAGASVIAKNLGESSGGRLNLMGEGTMINSIFGFCDVRQFTDTTECLQEEVMLFVNRIAHILHGIVVQCSGSANKNIGDAFLLTWKVEDNLTPAEVSKLADQALLAFCKTLVELNRYEEFICNFTLGATARLIKRFPDYHVRIGSGLHFGWAIEGAIGSNRKIDASYLSPNVNFTEFLESSTKAYGVPLLMSEPFFSMLSPAAARFCRQVDRVRKSEADNPTGLFTYDSDLGINFADPHRKRPSVAPSKGLASLKLAAKKAVEAKRRQSTAAGGAVSVEEATQSNGRAVVAESKPQSKRSSIGNVVLELKDEKVGDKAGDKAGDKSGDEETGDAGKEKRDPKDSPTIILPKYTEDIWETDADLVDLRHRVNDSFRATWAEGIAAYIKGDWHSARDIFHETMALSKGRDGPSKFLIEIIDEHKGSAPHDWPGYRTEGGGH